MSAAGASARARGLLARGSHAGLALVLLAAVLAPEPIVLGALRLTAFAVATTGATLLISRTGAADLAVAAAVAAGAYAGGVGTALLLLPVVLGLPLGALAGAIVGAASGALHGRLGRLIGALAALTLGGAVVAVLGAWPAGGGVAGFHAVGLPTPWGDRADLAAVGLVLVAAVAIQARCGASRWTAAASVAVRAPAVSAALGRHPVRDAARVGAVGGALLGLGGVTLAAVDGSVLPGAYGLELTAALALAALLGGPGALGPVVGALVVWGPGTLWPLVPLVGAAPPLLVLGPAGLAFLALRRGRPLLPAPRSPSIVAGSMRSDGAGDEREPAMPRAPTRLLTLVAEGLETPAGPLDLRLEPGEVVALVGPNGAGKSTALARLGGQLPDGGAVTLGRPAPRPDPPRPEAASPSLPGRRDRAPRGAAARARLGVARTWQRTPDVPAGEVERLVVDGSAARSATRWAAHVLGAEAAGAAAALVWVAARGPALALLDEPTDVPADRLVTYLRGLAGVGTAVLVVDHRPEVAAAADRVISLGVPQEVP